jgi:phenylacetate-CoA ligase
MFAQAAIQDFKGEAITAPDGQDRLVIFIELRRGVDPNLAIDDLTNAFKYKFEQTCAVEVLETGTLAREFEKSVKAPRFIDRR